MRAEQRQPRGPGVPLHAVLRGMSGGCVDKAWLDSNLSGLLTSIRTVRDVVALYHHITRQAAGWPNSLHDGRDGRSNLCLRLPSLAPTYTQMDPRSLFKTTQIPRRLFLAFYPRAGSSPDENTHTALLLVPTTPNVEQHDTIRYHICIRRGSGWDYKRDRVQARTPQLATAVLVAEVPARVSESDISRVMASVPIRHCDPNWSCYHWACSALCYLQQAGLIGGLPAGDLMQVWKHGLRFCQLRHGDAEGGDVPVCDAAGRPLRAMF